MRARLPSAGLWLCAVACAPPAADFHILSSEQTIEHRTVYRIDWRSQVRPEFDQEPPLDARLLRWAPQESAAPIVVPQEDEIVAGSSAGKLVAMGFDGKPRWTYAAHGPILQAATFSDGKIYAASADGGLHALEAATGHELWSHDLGEEPATPPVVAGGVVYVATHQASVFAVDAGTGQRRWHYRRERDPSRDFTLRTVATPTVAGGLVFTGFSDGTTVALGADGGTVVWQRASGPGDQFVDAGATPQVVGQEVFVANYRDGILALAAKDGELIWRKPFKGATGLLLRDGILFAAGVGKVAAFAPADGSLIWEKGLGDRTPGLLRVADAVLVVPATDALDFLDERTGLRLGDGFSPGWGVDAPVAVAGREIYVLSNAGWLYALGLP